MEHLQSVAALAGRPRTPHAANDNQGRRISFTLAPPSAITIAEIEVFGALLAELEAASANENLVIGDAA